MLQPVNSWHPFPMTVVLPLGNSDPQLMKATRMVLVKYRLSARLYLSKDDVGSLPLSRSGIGKVNLKQSSIPIQSGLRS